jgi:NodT family efflux transporter outer membrane factor (OMF) lipoprotein
MSVKLHHTARFVILACLVMGGLSGCGLKHWAHNSFKVGPEYCPPVEPVASQWIDYTDPRVISSPADLSAWWSTFNDPVLNDLVQTAHFQNLTLRQAGARIMEYRARLQFARGTMFPQQQGAFGSFNTIRESGNTANVRPDLKFNEWDAGLSASWEVDFWGRFRRGIEQADAELEASVENYDDVLVLLISEVAKAYTDLRTYQQRLAYARGNVNAQEGFLKIAEDKFRIGTATERDVQQARTVLNETRSLVPAYEAGVRLANNQLCVLLGTPPRDMTSELGEAAIPLAAPEVVVGIPADLVRRRPDVRRAERELAAQSARIGIATTNLYPHLGLNGNIGVTAKDFDGLFDGHATAGGFGPYFRWDLLNYGRLVSLINIEDARFEQLLYSYEQQVLVAGREAEDGLITYLRAQESVRNLQDSAAAASRTTEISSEQYRQGAVDFTAVFVASATLASQQDKFAAAQGATTQSLIDLYRALGGGWEIRLNRGRVFASRPAVPAVQLNKDIVTDMPESVESESVAPVAEPTPEQ